MYSSLRRTTGAAGFCEAKVMKKSYETPILEINKFESEDIITTSGLINGGANGSSTKESFSSLFGN